MGRYMEMGVASQIRIIKKDDCELTPTELEKNLRKDLKRFINTDDYESEIYQNGVVFTLKEDVFNNNIHDLISKLSKKMYLSILDYELEDNTKVFQSKEFNQENHPLTLKMDDDGKPTFFYKDEEIGRSSSIDWHDNYWLVSYSPDKSTRKVTITFDVLSLWYSYDKIFSEDDVFFSRFFNNIKTDFGTKLGKDVIIFING